MYGNGTFVAIGPRTIATSTDGITWASIIPEHIITLKDLAFGSNLFVAVGDSGKMLSSSDGKNWSLLRAADSTFFFCVEYGNERFVAMGTSAEGGKSSCYTSPDGLNWTQQKQIFPSYVYHTAFGNSMFIAVCRGSDREPIYSSTDGENWNYCSADVSDIVKTIFVNDRFFVFSQHDQVTGVSTSSDAKNWTTILPSYSSLSYSATYVNGLYIIQKSDGIALTSPDCTTWTERNTGINKSPLSIAIGPATIVGTTSPGGIVTSSDGISWTQQVAPGSAAELYSVAYGNGRFVAVEQDGHTISSTDALTWKRSDSSVSKSLRKVSFVNDIFFGICYSSEIYTSPDGINWSAIQLPTSKIVEVIAYYDGLYVLAGAGNVFTSNDAETWTVHNPGVDDGFDWISYVNGKFLLFSNDGWLLSSPDGVNWTKETYNGPLTGITSIAYGNGKYIGVGFHKIVSSTDGSTWTVEDSTIKVNFFNLMFCNNQFVAIASDRCATSNRNFVSDNNRIVTSADGKNWTSYNIGQAENIYALTYGDNRFVAVGANCAILVSEADNSNVVFPSRSHRFDKNAFEITNKQNNIFIKCPPLNSHEKYTVKLMTSSGRKTPCNMTWQNKEVLQIPATGLSSGIYHLLISGESGQICSSKFILMR